MSIDHRAGLCTDQGGHVPIIEPKLFQHSFDTCQPSTSVLPTPGRLFALMLVSSFFPYFFMALNPLLIW